MHRRRLPADSQPEFEYRELEAAEDFPIAGLCDFATSITKSRNHEITK